jgi:hypothetical protein
LRGEERKKLEEERDEFRALLETEKRLKRFEEINAQMTR